MALVKCKECGKKVSNKAETCIECGYPLSKSKKNGSEEIKTLQKTRKSLKLQLLLSKIILIGGIIALFYVYGITNDSVKIEIYTYVVIASFILYLVTKIRIWWNHD